MFEPLWCGLSPPGVAIVTALFRECVCRLIELLDAVGTSSLGLTLVVQRDEKSKQSTRFVWFSAIHLFDSRRLQRRMVLHYQRRIGMARTNLEVQEVCTISNNGRRANSVYLISRL